MIDKSFNGQVAVAPGKEALAEKLAGDVARHLHQGIEQRGEATLVVSGGSTPAPFFKALSDIEIDWSKVKVTLADERWVPPDHESSNEKLIRECLFVNQAASATFVSLYSDVATPDDGWSVCQQVIESIDRPFDVVVLGMGDDGHTASLFPDTKGLSEACALDTEKLCWPMYPTHLKEARMTLTLAALLDCRQLILHMTGQSKSDVFNKALVDGNLPISSVLSAASDRLQVYWTE